MSHTENPAQTAPEGGAGGQEQAVKPEFAPTPTETMESHAAALLDEVREAMTAPMLTRMNSVPGLVESLGDFCLTLARRVDRITPFLDEAIAEAQTRADFDSESG